MCQGLLPSRRHIEKREDPGDEVGRRPWHTAESRDQNFQRGWKFKMAAKRRSGYEIPPVRKNINKMADALHTLQSS